MSKKEACNWNSIFFKEFFCYRLAEFRQAYLPENNIPADVAAACINVSASEFDWEAIRGLVKATEVDAPPPAKVIKVNEKDAAALANVKRHKNVLVPKGASIEFVPGESSFDFLYILY